MWARTGYNPKRKIAVRDALTPAERGALAARVTYGGNPEHKRSPGDYRLTPPASPRPAKTLCDGERPILKGEAIALLQAGLRKGTTSAAIAGGWPQNVWSVSAAGEVFEAQLENAAAGTYHGYPVPENDDFRRLVLSEWAARD
jgi:hypothetical protein